MARDFNGTADRIDWASVFTTSGQALTISLWLYGDDFITGHNQYLFASQRASDNADGTLFMMADFIDTGVILFQRRFNVLNKDRASNLNEVPPGSWTHLLVTDDGSVNFSGTHIYHSGSEVAYDAGNEQDGSGTEVVADGTWSLGGRVGGDTNNFNGRLAEVGVWNRELAVGEIAALAKGYKPANFLTNLKFYAPLIGITTDNLIGAAASTMDGTSIIAHTRIIGGSPPLLGRHTDAAAPVAGGGGIMSRFRFTYEEDGY